MTGVVIGGESSSHLRDQVMPVLADLTVKTEKIEPLAKTLGTWEHLDFKRVLTLMKKEMTENV